MRRRPKLFLTGCTSAEPVSASFQHYKCILINIVVRLKSDFNLVNPFSVKDYRSKIYVSNSGVVPPPFFMEIMPLIHCIFFPYFIGFFTKFQQSNIPHQMQSYYRNHIGKRFLCCGFLTNYNHQ